MESIEQKQLADKLSYINPVAVSYKEWIDVGMALKQEGMPLAMWDEWSQKDPVRYHEGEPAEKWDSFHGSDRPITGATITDMAKKNGWKPRKSDDGHELGWNDEISDDGANKPAATNDIERGKLQEPADEWKPTIQLIHYLETLYNNNDLICYVNETWEDNGKWKPSNKDHFRTVGELITGLKKHKDDIGAVLGDQKGEGGAWICINPLKEKGRKKEDIADFRYVLIESDEIPIEEQYKALKRLNLPIATLTHSGGKSLHAVVHVDAANEGEYGKRVKVLYDYCKEHGFPIDESTKNPSRLTRLAGCMRGDKKQFLIDTNIGAANYKEWEQWKAGDDLPADDFPEDVNLSTVWDHMPPLAPTLIDGVLRQGHKMLLAGPSKAGKSFALIELCIAIAEGKKWMGFQCTQGEVYYINLELDSASCLHRFKDVYRAMKIPPDHMKNIVIWNLRGKSRPLEDLVPEIIKRGREHKYMAIIIDPMYKINDGDENSARDMGLFCNQMDKIANGLNCAVIYCHHHSKGMQGFKASMDRASGSGVFARDADAILDMIQLYTKDESENDEIGPTAWRITGTLREFEPFTPVNVYFTYPIHEVDEHGMLKMAAEEGSKEAGQQKGRNKQAKGARTRRDDFPTAFDAVAVDGRAKVTDIAQYFSKDPSTIRGDLKEKPLCDEFENVRGEIRRKEHN